MGQVLDGLDYLHEHEWVNWNVDHHSILVLARDLLFIKLVDGTLHGITNLEKPEGYHDLHASQKIGPALDQLRRDIWSAGVGVAYFMAKSQSARNSLCLVRADMLDSWRPTLGP